VLVGAGGGVVVTGGVVVSTGGLSWGNCEGGVEIGAGRSAGDSRNAPLEDVVTAVFVPGIIGPL
jgi:hypothetical protein